MSVRICTIVVFAKLGYLAAQKMAISMVKVISKDIGNWRHAIGAVRFWTATYVAGYNPAGVQLQPPLKV